MANSAVVDGKKIAELSDESLVENEKNEKQTQERTDLIQGNRAGQFDEKVLLLDIQRQLTDRDQYLRAKDLQIKEMEERMLMYVHSYSYRLGRSLTWPLRVIKRLFGS